MKFCQAYGCEKRATCHGVLCDIHFAKASNKMRTFARVTARTAREDGGAEACRIYTKTVDALVADVNRQLTPPAGAVAARPEPKGPAGSFAGSAFNAPPPRNRVEEI